MDPVKENVRYLELLASFVQFVGQRLQYLFEHPDGVPGQSSTLDKGALEVGVLVQGAVVDVLGEIGCELFQDLGHVANFDMPTPDALFVGFRLRSNDEPSGAGAQLLKALARAGTVAAVADGYEWRIEVDAASLRRGLAMVAPHMTYLRL